MVDRRNAAGRDIPSRRAQQRAEFAELLGRGAYEELEKLLESLQTATAADNAALSEILSAARQICAACAQYRNDLKSHLHIHEEALRREAELQHRLDDVFHHLGVEQQASDSPGPALCGGARLKQTPALDGAVQNVGGTGRDAEPEPIEADVACPEDKAARSPPVGDSDKSPALSVYCMGAFHVYIDEHAIRTWPSRKAKLIFKFLLAHRTRPVSREVLMDHFWPEADTDPARNNLNVAMSSLRQSLRQHHPEFKYVLLKDDCYSLNAQMQIWIDAEAFMRALGDARDFERQGDSAAAVDAYQVAEDLYQGPFLAEDRYEDWPRSKRQALQENYLEVLNRLGEYYLDQGMHGPCAEVCRKLLAIDDCREDIHRRLMRCYCRHGQRHLAMRQYHSCADALERELELLPDANTTKLYSAIRDDQPI